MLSVEDSTIGLGAYTWWRLARADALLTGVLPQQQPFRESAEREVELCLLPNEEDADSDYSLHYVVGRKREADLFIEMAGSLPVRIDAAELDGPRIQSWAAPDYMAVLAELAESRSLSLTDCAKRYGKVTVSKSERGWYFHPALGYTKRT